MKRKLLLLAAAIGAVLAAPASAHHSFAAMYFPDKTVTIQGRVVQVLYRNPQSFLDVAVEDGKGHAETWTVEWGGGGQLSRAGVTKDTLKPGDVLVVTGNPARNAAERKLHMVRVRRPSDGWTWSETE